MIQVNTHISLQQITKDDYEELHTLMQEVYPPAYEHFWKDDGSWYIQQQYSKENILKELSEEKADYYFVLFNGIKIGNFRIVWDEKLENFPSERAVKLHRLYLLQNTQGKGIGKTVLHWLEEKAKQKGYEILWLDAMNEKQQAFEFYKKLGYQYHSHCFLEFELLHDYVRKMSQLYKKLN